MQKADRRSAAGRTRPRPAGWSLPLDHHANALAGADGEEESTGAVDRLCRPTVCGALHPGSGEHGAQVGARRDLAALRDLAKRVAHDEPTRAIERLKWIGRRTPSTGVTHPCEGSAGRGALSKRKARTLDRISNVSSSSLVRKVIDSNAMRSAQLHAYLATNPRNMAVVTEYAGIEAHKASDPLKGLAQSLEVLSKFPDQVIILKGTQALCGLTGRGKGLQRRLIDDRATANFARYCDQIEKARAGDTKVRARVLELGRDARALADRLLADVPEVKEGRRQVASLYTEGELRTIRTHSVISPALGEKIRANVMLLAALLFRNHPKVTEWPEADTVTNHYLFRYALCAQLWLLEWVSHGSGETSNPTRVRNDMIDLHFATCATYFDGLMSEDVRALRVSREAARLLPRAAG
jgi:hypothetical protein